MAKLVLFTMITVLLWIPLLAQAESVGGPSPMTATSMSTSPFAEADGLFS